jgi:Ion channel
VPNAFAGLSVSDSPALGSNMLYFSFGTLTTAGSGDIAPVHPIARSLVNIEAMIGQLYPATLLARLVTLEIEDEAGR